jgi:hypothetical protein
MKKILAAIVLFTIAGSAHGEANCSDLQASLTQEEQKEQSLKKKYRTIAGVY